LAAKGEENEIILALEALNEINIKLNEA
jgi:hypothetical protein